MVGGISSEATNAGRRFTSAGPGGLLRPKSKLVQCHSNAPDCVVNGESRKSLISRQLSDPKYLKLSPNRFGQTNGHDYLKDDRSKSQYRQNVANVSNFAICSQVQTNKRTSKLDKKRQRYSLNEEDFSESALASLSCFSDKIAPTKDSVRSMKRRSWTLDSSTTLESLQDKQCSNSFSTQLSIDLKCVEKGGRLIDLEREHSAGSASSGYESGSDIIGASRLNSFANDSYPKSILKSPSFASRAPRPSGRHISYDPLTLILDAALDGELHLVIQCAYQLCNINEANAEGVTALHNAVCAGHADVVDFLIQVGADVNARDSDGWSPLHCAASCNNLTLTKKLVASGACIYDSTIVDHELPSAKCPEAEVGGAHCCADFLKKAEIQIGTISNGVVYAAYDYEPMAVDELEFFRGDALVIISKDSHDQLGWWKAFHPQTNQFGFVPRNYFSIYPRLKR